VLRKIGLEFIPQLSFSYKHFPQGSIYKKVLICLSNICRKAELECPQIASQAVELGQND
jgi:hypothetical protein